MTTTNHLDALLARFHDGLSDACDRAALADALLDAGKDELADRVRSGETMTPAASRFVGEMGGSWDSFGPFQDTAEKGLSDFDENLLRQFCGEQESEYAASEADVMLHVMGHVAACRMRQAEEE